MNLILFPKEILSPVGSVSKWLSSNTEFKDSIHSGSISPSLIIQHNVSYGYFTTSLALDVNTPSVNSLVSLFILPNN
jgi:hypothetical protein